LKEASAALAKALEATQGAGTDELGAEMVSAIIRGVTMVDRQAWVRRYYSDGAWAGIVTRRFSYSSEQLEEAQRAWQDLFAAFERHRGQPPDSPDVQALAGQMNALIESFTGGDPEAEAGLERFARDAEMGNLPPELAAYAPYGGADEDLHRFMQQALTTYRERRQK
jgi:hypothetical protein